MALSFGLVFVLGIFMLKKYCNLSQARKEKLEIILLDTKKKFMWNKTIESIKFSFMPNLLVMYSTIKTAQLKEDATAADYIVPALLGMFSLGFICLTSYHLHRNRKVLR